MEQILYMVGYALGPVAFSHVIAEFILKKMGYLLNRANKYFGFFIAWLIVSLTIGIFNLTSGFTTVLLPIIVTLVVLIVLRFFQDKECRYDKYSRQ